MIPHPGPPPTSPSRGADLLREAVEARYSFFTASDFAADWPDLDNLDRAKQACDASQAATAAWRAQDAADWLEAWEETVAICLQHGWTRGAAIEYAEENEREARVWPEHEEECFAIWAGEWSRRAA